MMNSMHCLTALRKNILNKAQKERKNISALFVLWYNIKNKINKSKIYNFNLVRL